MVIKPILSVVLNDILTKGYFAVKNYAGLPLEEFKNLVEKELNALSNLFYIKGTNEKIVKCCNDENKCFAIYVTTDNLDKLFSQLTV